jgi:hypothetical protein
LSRLWANPFLAGIQFPGSQLPIAKRAVASAAWAADRSCCLAARSYNFVSACIEKLITNNCDMNLGGVAMIRQEPQMSAYPSPVSTLLPALLNPSALLFGGYHAGCAMARNSNRIRAVRS